MNPVTRFLKKLRILICRKRFYSELEEEMAFHREQTENDLQADGIAREEILHAARRRFGNTTRLKEQSHEIVGFPFERILQDCRYAIRQLVKSPGFASTVVLTLALGIGATTSIFTLVHSVLLRDLPYPEADRIIHIRDVRTQGQSTGPLVGIPRFFDIRDQSKSFASIAYFYFDHPTLIAGTQLPRPMKSVGASGQFWRVYGVQPFLGRTFDENDDRPNMPEVIVLSYSTWQEIFGGDPSVIGRQVSLDQQPATIIGVMPQSFHTPSTIEMWRPAHYDPAEFKGNRNEGTRFANVFARLKPGVSLQAAQKELRFLGEQLQRRYPATDAVWQFGSESLRDYLYGELRPALVVVFLASSFLLLIACINVANLLLSRATAREREVALRRALGASEGRIRLQFLTESTLLSLIGGCLGIAGSFALIHGIANRLPGRLGTPGTVAMDWPVVWFAFALSVTTGIAFGLAPVLQNRRVDLNITLKCGESRLTGSAGGGIRNTFIAVQVGLSLVLLVGASLLMKSLWNLLNSPLGFEPDHVLTFEIKLPWDEDRGVVRNFFANVQHRIESLPGVRAVGQIDALPTDDWHLRSNFDADWLPRIADHPAINAEDRHISGDYLKAIGTPLLSGRTFTPHDDDAKITPVLINQQLVLQYLPNGNPIGRHLFIGQGAFEIVGVIRNVRGTAGSIAKAAGAEVYFPADGDRGVVHRFYVIRSHVPPEQLIKSIREQVHEVDSQQAIGNVSTMDDRIDQSVAQPRFNMALVASFAVIALLLACVGTYGIVAYSVAQRTQEIGVRIALGATKGQISLLFVRRAMTSAMIGLAVGISATFFLTRLLRNQLYGVEPNNSLIFAISILALFFPILLATLQPALRAASVNPVEALRAE